MSMGGGGGDGGAGKLAKAAGKRADAAAKKIDEYGTKAINFTDTFFKKYVEPQLATIQAEQTKGIQRADEVYGQQQAQFQDREGTYLEKGKPAINNYFDQVAGFDPEAEAQRQGLTMSGDVAAGLATARASTMRGLSDRGINPNSGSTIAALGRQDTAGALVKAKEMARLRSLTNQQKMTMTADAANFGAGLGGQAGALSGQALKAGVIGTDIGTQSTGALVAGQGIPMSGLELASQGQGQLYSGATNQQTNAVNMKAQAEANEGSGFGKLLGTVVGGVGGFMLGGPAGALTGAKIGSGIA